MASAFDLEILVACRRDFVSTVVTYISPLMPATGCLNLSDTTRAVDRFHAGGPSPGTASDISTLLFHRPGAATSSIIHSVGALP
jgi:hypothetical protein